MIGGSNSDYMVIACLYPPLRRYRGDDHLSAQPAASG